MELELLEKIGDSGWDEIISSFRSKGLYHQSVWLGFINKIEKGDLVRLRIKDENSIVGYFVGYIVKKGPFRILGSPMAGWSTEFIGPIMSPDEFDQAEFFLKMDGWCRQNKIDLFEVSNHFLDPKIMQKAGFNGKKRKTFVVSLAKDKELMWRNLDKGSCRWAINKAVKNGLVAENICDPAIIKEFCLELEEVFFKQNLVPTYSYEKVKSLFDALKPQNSILTIGVKYNSKIIATGFFPHDEKYLYFWGGASRLEFQHLFPNELLHWKAMLLASEKGIEKYDLAGTSSFKRKFGGELIEHYHWHKSYNPFVNVARCLYERQFYVLRKIKGLIKNVK